jgi:hypothetical protein
MYKKSFLQPILFGLITILFVASCDKDFNELGTDIVGDDHFGFEVDSSGTVKIYNQKLGPIASNNLAVNPLGFYTNPAFGTTQANFVTQLELSSFSPTFNNTNPSDYRTGVDYGPTELDSVIIEIPYFRKFIDEDDGVSTYQLDSIYGETPYDKDIPATVNSKFKLEIYQSGYYLRDLDPNEGLGAVQSYYTDQDNIINPIGTPLNNSPQDDIPTAGILNADGHENNKFYFDKREHAIKGLSEDGTRAEEPTRSVPSMRLHLDKAFFDNLILHAPAGKLADNATFKNYMRGLYFKVDHGENSGDGNMALLNFKAGKITLYYNEDKKKTVNNLDTYERLYKTFVINLGGNSISLLQNSNENTDYLTAANSSNEASRVYLKGGEGSIAVIDLFGTVDLKGLTPNPNYTTSSPASLTNPRFKLDPAYDPSLPISDTNPKYLNTGPNGISDEIDKINANDWLINEANLTFNIDDSRLGTDVDKHIFEPARIYLYDLTNKQPIIDYSYDLTSNGTYPKFNKLTFGGMLANNKGFLVKQIRGTDGYVSNKGSKYKIRITNYVRSLVKNDSTNVRLGLSVTENINTFGFSKLRTPNSNVDRAPAMSVMNPLGTILYGTNIPVAQTQEYKKRLKLEIYYTKPN